MLFGVFALFQVLSEWFEGSAWLAYFYNYGSLVGITIALFGYKGNRLAKIAGLFFLVVVLTYLINDLFDKIIYSKAVIYPRIIFVIVCYFKRPSTSAT